jgi:hypothetical protein
VSPLVVVVSRGERKMPLFKAFAEPICSRGMFCFGCPIIRGGRRDGCERSSATTGKGSLCVRKVFNLEPKFIDSGNVQE